MFEDRLIHEIYRTPCIWDKKCIEYRNKKFKDSAWQRISVNVDESEETCRKRWKSLRDRFVIELSGRQKHSASATKRGNWQYFNDLIFLSDSVKTRSSSANLSADEDEEYLEQHSDEQESSQTETYLLEADIADLIACSSPEGSRPNSPVNPRNNTDNTDNNKRAKLEKSFELLTQNVNDFLNTKKKKTAQDNFLAAIGEFFEKVPEERKMEFKMDILSFTHRKFKEYNM